MNKILDKEFIKTLIPSRPETAHKGTFGSCLIIAGSKNYPGAAILSCLGAARVGTGLVTLATTNEVYKVAAPKIPSVTFLSFSEVKYDLDKYDSVLIGPGLGQSEEIKNLLTELINLDKLKEKKLVIDADGLNIFSEISYWFKILKTDLILTPHPGEMSRLSKLTIKEIENNREVVAKKFSKLWHKTIVLKGAETIISDPQGEIFISPFKNPLLATAGTGDVLAGMITGFLSQGLNLTNAAIVGVYLHGLSAEKLKEKFGDRGMVATDLIEVIPQVFKDLI